MNGAEHLSRTKCAFCAVSNQWFWSSAATTILTFPLNSIKLGPSDFATEFKGAYDQG